MEYFCIRKGEKRMKIPRQFVVLLNCALTRKAWIKTYRQCCGSGMFIPDPGS
jgi:hypothetical protein